MLRSWEREDQVSPECDPLRGGPGCGLVHGRSCSSQRTKATPSELAGQWAQAALEVMELTSGCLLIFQACALFPKTKLTRDCAAI